jgi:hypothetical protein
MVPGGTLTELTDRPTNTFSQVGIDTLTTTVNVSPAYMWRLYVGHVAFALMLETSHQLPWSVTSYDATQLRYVFDSATMAWQLPSGDFGMGTYAGANMPTLRANNRPITTFSDPRWTYPWLKQAGLIGTSRYATIGSFLDWMRHNLTHAMGGADDFISAAAIWGYRGYSPISQIVNGTLDSRYPSYGTMHWTEGCHGSVGFISAALRVLNLPVQPLWACGHELAYFVSEDLYLDHGDDPYNGVVRGSTASSLLLLIDAATYQTRFGADLTTNFLPYSGVPCTYVGYTAINFPP